MLCTIQVGASFRGRAHVWYFSGNYYAYTAFNESMCVCDQIFVEKEAMVRLLLIMSSENTYFYNKYFIGLRYLYLWILVQIYYFKMFVTIKVYKHYWKWVRT